MILFTWSGGVSSPGGCLVLEKCLLLGGLVPGWGVSSQGGVGVPDGDPLGRPLLRAVRILLVYILVKI